MAWCQFDAVAHSELHPVNSVPVGRCVAFVVHISSVHKSGRGPESLTDASVRVVVSVIKVCKSEGVAVFVAECAYACEIGLSRSSIAPLVKDNFPSEFGCASVTEDFLSAQGDGFAE